MSGRESNSSTSPIKALCIVGMTRSGSTLLDNLLGELDGFFSAGELHYIWERGLQERRRCGCGAPVVDCELWSSVLKRVFPDVSAREIDPKELIERQDEVVRTRHTRRLLRRHRRESSWEPLDSYLSVISDLYRSVAEVTGASVIVDSSKRPSDAALTALIPGVSPYFVHLVRDPRGVAYSWRRHKKELDRSDIDRMPQHGPVHSASRWLGLNLVSELVSRRHGAARSLLVRYEDLVTHPGTVLEAIANLVGEPVGRLPLEGETMVHLSGNHAVAGNPSRFRTGSMTLREDGEWRRCQKVSDRLVTTALAAPLLKRYGYGFSLDGAP